VQLVVDPKELEAVIAQAAPLNEGEPWSPKAIALAIAQFAQDEATAAQAEADAWSKGREGFAVRFTNSGVAMGNPERITAMQAEAEAKHAKAVADKIASNKALISTVGSSVLAIATLAMGGAPLTALVPQAMGIATLVASAMNGPDKEPPTT